MLTATLFGDATMSAQTLRQQVHSIADELPPEATWEDVMYQVEMHASIERGLAQVKAGNTISAEDLLVQQGSKVGWVERSDTHRKIFAMI